MKIGHWYGDKREFNFLTVLNTTETLNLYNQKFGECKGAFDFEALQSMAITTGMAELTAQAYYLGFSMWKDLTYPLFGQYILSNGQDFSLANYQLNTLRLWSKATTRNNLCDISVPERYITTRHLIWEKLWACLEILFIRLRILSFSVLKFFFLA